MVCCIGARMEVGSEEKRLNRHDTLIAIFVPFPVNIIILLFRLRKAEKPQRKRIWSYIAVWLVFVSVIGIGIAFVLYQPWLAPRMVNYYSNDSNFSWFIGTVTTSSRGTNQYGHFTYHLEMTDYILYEEGGSLRPVDIRGGWTIFSPDIERTWDKLNPHPGLEIRFRGTTRIFFDGCPMAIVELVSGGETVLTFEEGKSALLEWARQVH